MLRASRPELFQTVSDILVASGVRVVEFALTTPGCLPALERYADTAPRESFLGAGTVLTAVDARAAVDAGARFLATPALLPEVVESGAALGVPVVAGALTPTEILAAYRTGATAVKVFPAGLGGPRYLSLIRDPLPQVPLLPTGGIGLEDAAAYIKAGAFAVGLGGSLVGDALEGGDLGALERRARQLAGLVEAAAVAQ